MTFQGLEISVDFKGSFFKYSQFVDFGEHYLTRPYSVPGSGPGQRSSEPVLASLDSTAARLPINER